MTTKKIRESKLEDTGERLIPELHREKIIYAEHMGRYQSIIHSTKGRNVLDIACGTGYGTQYIAKSASKVFGVDISADAVKYAQNNYPASNLEYKVGSGTSIPLEDSSVDVVVSMETIEHIMQQDEFLAEVKRVLVKGGNFFVSTPNDQEYPKGNHFHVREHNPASLKKLLKRYFKNVDIYYQVDEIAASIFSEKRLGKEYSDESWNITKNIPLDKEKCIYFLASCSDNKPALIDENTVLGEYYSYHEVSRQWNRERELWLYTQELEPKVQDLMAENQRLQRQLQEITHSRSYKLANGLQKTRAKIRRSR